MIRDVFEHLLHIGNALDARDLALLYEHQISAVVDLAVNEAPAQLGRDLVYLRIPLNDGYGNSDTLIKAAISNVAMLIENRVRTLVACSAGMSRSPAITAAAIANVTGRDPDECLREIVALGPHDVSPTLWESVVTVYNQMS